MSPPRLNEARMQTVLLDLWGQCRGDWRFVSERLSRAFRQARQLRSAERRHVAETIYGMVRSARTLDHCLAEAGVPLWAPDALGEMPSPRAELDLLAYRLLEGVLDRAEATRRRPDVAWTAVLAARTAIEEIADPQRRLALAHSLPDWLASALIEELGEAEASNLASAINARAPLTLRVNTLATTREAVLAELERLDLDPIPTRWAQDGITIGKRVNVFGLDAFKSGHIEVQDEGSQLVAEVVAPPVRGLVIDACAGAGGKTLALGAAMRNKGRLVATDMAAHKLRELSRRARRAGLSNHRAIPVSAEGPLPPEVTALEGKADRVFVDAPCSGVGSMRRTPEARWRLSADYVAALPDLQLRLVERVLPLLKPGGRLVYATCTMIEAENEALVRRVIEAEPRLERITVKEILGKARAADITSEDGLALKTSPHRHGMDGFYATALRLAR